MPTEARTTNLRNISKRTSTRLDIPWVVARNSIRMHGASSAGYAIRELLLRLLDPLPRTEVQRQ